MKHGAIADLRGASKLAVDAIERVATVVEAMHHTIARGPAVLGRPLEAPSGILTRTAYGSVRVGARFVAVGLDSALAAIEALASGSPANGPGTKRSAVIAALNGVVGDYLAEQGNPLAIEMTLRHDGRDLELESSLLAHALPDSTPKLLVIVHGSCMHDGQWNHGGHDHGAVLARDLGLTPIYVRYNSGLHVSTNGRRLSDLLESLASSWPGPLEEITFLAHSMGGLVARSACFYAEDPARKWRTHVRRLFCIGTPHHGAALERAGSLVEPLLGISQYSAPFARLGRLRSAGITDLRYGSVLDEDWQQRDRFAIEGDVRAALPLPSGVACYAIAGSRAASKDGRLWGDGLVAVNSALGRHADSARCLAFPEAHQWTAHGTGHLALLGSTQVHERLHAWFAT